MIGISIFSIAPVVMVGLLAFFITSRKWRHDRILLLMTIVTTMCMIGFYYGKIEEAITVELVAFTIAIVYSSFFRRRRPIAKINFIRS
jgi:hypothetical protein